MTNANVLHLTATPPRAAMAGSARALLSKGSLQSHHRAHADCSASCTDFPARWRQHAADGADPMNAAPRLISKMHAPRAYRALRQLVHNWVWPPAVTYPMSMIMTRRLRRPMYWTAALPHKSIARWCGCSCERSCHLKAAVAAVSVIADLGARGNCSVLSAQSPAK